ncbi:S-layer homology domain-containing protein [Paenibacillus kandeliae]|uniref:S-layer homology domain-containing protein n=1 Tax=Paenibacillus kandeliae TaxID=3231269 RepID=UPI0034580181
MCIRKWIIGLTGALLIAAPGNALAFDDLDQTNGREEIQYLKTHDIIAGITGNEFQPDAPLTNAQGIAFLVKGLHLNIDHLRFIKAPKASDYFTDMDDHAWYSTDMMIAQLNGLELAQNINTDATMSRVQFASLLWQGVEQLDPDIHESGGATGALQDNSVKITDAGSLNDYQRDVLSQIIDSDIAQVDAEGNFRPDVPITRAEAAVMLYNALELTGKIEHDPADEKN